MTQTSERPLWQVACYENETGEAIGGSEARVAVLALGATKIESLGDNDPDCGLWLADLPWTDVVYAEVIVQVGAVDVLVTVETP